MPIEIADEPINSWSSWNRRFHRSMLRSHYQQTKTPARRGLASILLELSCPCRSTILPEFQAALHKEFASNSGNRVLIAHGTDYHFTVKGNQPELERDFALLFQPCGAPDFAEVASPDHGRIETRRIWCSTALNDYIGDDRNAG